MANHALKKIGFWGDVWSKRLHKWFEHLCRHKDSWVARLMHTRGREWLWTQRALFPSAARSLDAGRTATRMRASKVHTRYEEGAVAWAIAKNNRLIVERLMQ